MGFPNETLKDNSAEEFTESAKNLDIAENKQQGNKENLSKEQVKAVIESYKEVQDEMREKYKASIPELQEEYRRGISVGAQAACEVVLKKLNNRSTPLMTKIADIKAFCRRPFGQEPEQILESTDDN